MINECIHNVNKDRLSIIFMMHHGWFQTNKQKIGSAGSANVLSSYSTTAM